MSSPSSRELLLSTKAYEILRQIPPAPEYISAREIAEKTNYTMRQVSATISSKLYPTFVTKEKREGSYHYQRLPIRGFKNPS